MTLKEVPQDVLSRALRLREFRPFRKVYIVKFAEEPEYRLYAEATARKANNCARKGADVWELKTAQEKGEYANG